MVSLWILLLLSNVNIAAALDRETRVQRVQELSEQLKNGFEDGLNFLDNMLSTSRQLKNEISALADEGSTLTTSVSDLQKDEHNLNTEVKQLEIEKNRLNDEVKTAERNSKILKDEVSNLEEKNSTLTTSVSDLQNKEKRLKDQVTTAEKTSKILKDEVSNLEEKSSTLTTSVSDLQNNEKRLNDEVTTAEKNSKILKDENNKAREHTQKLKDGDKELIQEIIASHGQSQNIVISVLIASIIMSASLNVKQYMNAKSEESEGQEKKKKRKEDLSLFSDDEDDNGEESASKNQPGFGEDKENVQRRSEEANSTIKLRFAEQKITNMTKAVEYLENLKQKFTLALDLQMEWQNMTVGESRKWDLWHLSEDDLLVVTRISMERTVNKEMLPAVTVSLKQGKGSVPPAFIHTLRKTKKKTGALNPPIVQRAFGSLGRWTGE